MGARRKREQLATRGDWKRTSLSLIGEVCQAVLTVVSRMYHVPEGGGCLLLLLAAVVLVRGQEGLPDAGCSPEVALGLRQHAGFSVWTA